MRDPPAALRRSCTPVSCAVGQPAARMRSRYLRSAFAQFESSYLEKYSNSAPCDSCACARTSHAQNENQEITSRLASRGKKRAWAWPMREVLIVRSTMENSSSTHGSSASALSGCASCCDARQEHGLATCSSTSCGLPKHAYGPVIGEEHASLLYLMLTREVDECLALNTIEASPMTFERPQSVLCSLLVGENVSGYETVRFANGHSTLMALLTDPTVGSKTMINRKIKPKRPYSNVTIPIKTSPKLPPFPTSKDKAMPRTAYAANKVKFREKCDDCWNSSSGIRLKASNAWDRRVLHGEKHTTLPAQRSPDRLMKFSRNSQTALNLAPVMCPVQRQNISSETYATIVDPAPDTEPRRKRESNVSPEDVAALRQKGKILALKLQGGTSHRQTKKTLEQKIGWRFVKRFKSDNKGIIWVQNMERSQENENH